MLCRKILVMLMAGWLLQISMGCFNHNQYEQSSLLLEENQREDLVISVQKVDDYGGIFIFQNDGNEIISYGDRNALEINLDGVWNSVLAYNQRELTEIAHQLYPGETVEYTTEWEISTAGDYRYIVPFRIVNAPVTDLQQYAVISFNIP